MKRRSTQPAESAAQVFIHPQALVESGRIGDGTRIWAFAHVLKGAVIGCNCNIGDGAFIEGGAQIGDNVTVKNQCLIWEGVTIADNAFIGPNVVFTNDLHPRSPRLPLARARYAAKKWLVPTVVGEGASLGASVTVLAGVTIGEFATVGIGSVVTRDLPPHALAFGTPARVRGHVCRCGQKITFSRGKARCAACGSRYQKQNHSVKWIATPEP
jgi:UDP-2-acetamido-3-amino-2,3-dideoxy-glucuronate N-acetyltransferase